MRKPLSSFPHSKTTSYAAFEKPPCATLGPNTSHFARALPPAWETLRWKSPKDPPHRVGECESSDQCVLLPYGIRSTTRLSLLRAAVTAVRVRVRPRV